jgi:hypothetical protein
MIPAAIIILIDMIRMSFLLFDFRDTSPIAENICQLK